eukprot:gene12252-biopygen8980
MPCDALMTPLKVGRYTMRNRVVMAPLTRCRADDEHVPTDLMVEYYGQRASMGLIVTEATQIREGYSTFVREGGIYGPKQIAGWKKVTDAVHAKGGLIFCQIHHGGRATVPENLSHGVTKVVSASAVGITQHQCGEAFNKAGVKRPYPVPAELTAAEIHEHAQLYVQAAKNAIEAGFDGVQIHGANGYLLDGFLKTSSNQRTDEYGGSIENRCRFLLEVVDGVIGAIGADRTALRLSPVNSFNDESDENPEALTTYLCEQLNQRPTLAFLDVMRADFFSAATGAHLWARKVYKGVLITGMKYTPAEAAEAVEKKEADAICFGTLAIANPDLVERAAKGAALNAPDPATFYSRGAEGYTTYPTLS